MLRRTLATHVFDKVLHELVVGILYGTNDGRDVQNPSHQLLTALPLFQGSEPHRLEHLAHEFLERKYYTVAMLYTEGTQRFCNRHPE